MFGFFKHYDKRTGLLKMNTDSNFNYVSVGACGNYPPIKVDGLRVFISYGKVIKTKLPLTKLHSMARIFCIFFSVCLVSNTSVGQAYVPIISTVDSSDIWVDVHSCTDFDCWWAYRNIYTVVGTISSGGTEYVQFNRFTEYEQGTDLGQWCNESFSTSVGIIGIREENKRVFVLPNPTSAESEEYLAYDFNLTVGDTVPDPYYFQTPGGPSDYNLVIHTIDSVYVSGTWRKRYQINSFPDIIEGIGSSSGLLNPLNFAWSGACQISLNCYLEQGVADFFTSNCELPLNSPSPALNENAHSRELLKIVDCTGRERLPTPNTLLFYIYSNGEVEKVFHAR